MKQVILPRLLLVFASGVIVTANASLPQNEASYERSLKKGVLIVRYENQSPVCFSATKEVRDRLQSSQIPYCLADGEIGVETKNALAAAVAGRSSQTAMLPHGASASIGCVVALSTVALDRGLKYFSDGRLPDLVTTVLPNGIAGGRMIISFMSSTDLSGVSIAAVAGYAACASGAYYLIYKLL